MSEETYFLDTYAIMEFIGGNKNYEPYLDKKFVIAEFNLAELAYTLFREKYSNSGEYLGMYKKLIRAVNPEWIIEAMKFRLKWKDRKVSIPDCIGYIMAKHLGIKFLTGDKEFEGLENVEFVR